MGIGKPFFLRFELLGNVFEIAHYPVLPVWQSHPLRLPLVTLLLCDVVPQLGEAWRNVVVACFQCVSEDVRALLTNFRSPEDIHHFV